MKQGRKPSKSATLFSKQLSAIQTFCLENGLEVSLSKITGTKRWVWHVVFRKDGRPMLHYWPSTGRVWNPETGEKYFVQDWKRAVSAVTEKKVEFTWKNSDTYRKRLERLSDHHGRAAPG